MTTTSATSSVSKPVPTSVPTQPALHAIATAVHGLDYVSYDELRNAIAGTVLPGMSPREQRWGQLYAARSLIGTEPNYSYVAARLLLDIILHEAFDEALNEAPMDRATVAERYPALLAEYVQHGVAIERLSPQLLTFDLKALGQALRPERDLTFTYLGLQTLYDRYFIHENERRLETPQLFWMRVAMGLALNEDNPTQRAIEFYEMMSTFRFSPSSPTLFNAGTLHPQLSSCFLTTVQDDLHSIFAGIYDNAMLSKWSGGLGNDWTNVRALGSYIKGTNGNSQGVVPFLKVANDTAVAVNQGGKRRGAVCAYLETWHLDIEDFLHLRRNTGDERRRTHDMHTAHWIPDLFMKRVQNDEQWTLFSPDDVPDLHDLYGREFETRYMHYEQMADRGEITHFKRVQAQQLWRRMLTMLFETGHPWITFKDPSNIRSTQDHAGVIHSSNLCTEILLNTTADEVAVCNLGSVNLAWHTRSGQLDVEALRLTVKTAMRMLDNVIDINFYPIEKARNANMRHRPVGLGMMGFQDALHQLKIRYASQEAVEFADLSTEHIAYAAILASAELAEERGTYASYGGSKWDRGLLPQDTIALLQEERGEAVGVTAEGALDWSPVREAIGTYGMRNSNVLAIAPTATISNIVGVSQSIEPDYRLLFTKSNLSGDFTVVNEFLIADLRGLGLWDEQMVADLLFYDGIVGEIARIPARVKAQYETAFEIDPHWLIECAARRQKWIDMGQSLNLYLAEPSGRKLSDMYMTAWKMGLKTTYYLRSLGASQIEKSTIQEHRVEGGARWRRGADPATNRRGAAVQDESGLSGANVNGASGETANVCLPSGPDDDICDACQ